jgi:hypothetical protein
MNRLRAVAALPVILSAAAMCRADFKYSQTSQITGGAMLGMMKFAGHFSKDTKDVTAPQQSTIYVKGNRMRRDEATGKFQIIDLDGRRIIEVDPQQHAYSVVTFDQMRQAMEQAKAQAQAENKNKNQNANVTVTPKIETTATGNSKTILGEPAKEVKMKMTMEMQSSDPRSQGQTASFWFNSDQWMARIPGSDELRQFHARMAKELDWMPGAMFGGTGMQMNMRPAMTEFQKHTAEMEGLPLLQYTSLGMGGAVPEGSASGAQTPPPSSQSSDSSASSSSDATAQALGHVLGGFGGFGHKKKKQQDDSAANANSGQPAAPPPAGASTPGSMMDITVEVTSFSSGSLDATLFDVPTGYNQVQGDASQMLGTSSRRR